MRCARLAIGFGVIGLLLVAGGCASVPKGRYGAQAVRFEGVEQMSEEALAACLATRERDAVHVRLGLGSSRCGDPPFDQDPPDLKLFSWPWEEWPVFDSALFDIDKKRIERWYQARGFYDARVVRSWLTADGEVLESGDRCASDDCELEVHVVVDEGKPVYIKRVLVDMLPDDRAALDLDLRRDLLELPQLTPGRRFDEAIYAADKERLLGLLKDRTYARAEVDGVVELDRDKRTAVVHYRVRPGPSCRIGDVRVEGQGELDADAIEEVAGLATGQPYRQSALIDAELSVFALGAISSVHVETVPPEKAPSQTGENVIGKADQDKIVDLIIRVTPGRAEHFRVGIGMMSGTMKRSTSEETFSVPQWDLHLKASYRDDDFFGGFRRFRIEDRPRLILLREFPRLPREGPRFGNTLSASFEQPRFLEHRTVLFVEGQWDFGPDAFYGYFRHDLATKLGLRRPFFRRRLTVEAAVQHDLYEITETPPPTASSYRLPFFEQTLTLDLRDDAVQPTRGAYVSTMVQEAVRLGYGSWDYVRVTPEARGYLRLPLKLVIAQRFALGWQLILDADPALDPVSEEVGPQTYRLRGGGANSNRGFGAGELGVGIHGGTRRWESSTELRVPLGQALTLALFFDMGDVARGKRIRFEHINASTGLGIRYHFSFATIRLDAGYRIPGWQRIGGDIGRTKLSVWPSALHLTLGEAF